MTELLSNRPAFGHPGIEPRWTRSDKEGVGTAYSASSLVWWTVSAGILNEVYFPTIDQPQVRDLQYMVTDGQTFCHDERRHTKSSVEPQEDNSLGYRIVNSDDENRYRIEKQIISAPHGACVLIHTRFIPSPMWRGKLQLYALLAPHLGIGGWGNTAQLATVNDQRVMVANHEGRWLALGCTRTFSNASCGYVGVSDGWQDLSSNKRLDWQFNIAADGNVAMIAEIPLGDEEEFEFTLGLAFGNHVHGAITSLWQSLAIPFESQQERFSEQWTKACRSMIDLDDVSQDGGRLYHSSYCLLLSHEDKSYPGAMIASLSIPWGEARGEEDLGGYHLVWTRDMVNSVLGLLAAGNTKTPFRALVYLACSQFPNGGFPQNFWIDGEPYWSGIQLDEVAFPILLAWKLHKEGCLRDFDPWPMVRAAAGYLIRQGPATPQERWEENSGYSPSTLASNIAALVCAAQFAASRGETATADYLNEYADFLECHIEEWTVTTEGTLVEGIPRHFIRIHPIDINDPRPNEDPNVGTVLIKNRAPGLKAFFPAKEIVDAGFLELVRFGIRNANDPVIVDSLKVVDSVLKVETPFGPCWHRYNRDGYGQRADGGPFLSWGQGRAWPLLTGERAHYELAAGHDVEPLVRTIESFASNTGLLPEQIWDMPDEPELRMFCGKPTGAAMPLMWAHAEYIKLLRSIKDGAIFDRIPAVADRYLKDRKRTEMEVWKFNRQIGQMQRSRTLRIQAHVAFRLRYSTDGWKSQDDLESNLTGVGVHFCDIKPAKFGNEPLQFTFEWVEAKRWEGRNFLVELV